MLLLFIYFLIYLVIICVFLNLFIYLFIYLFIHFFQAFRRVNLLIIEQETRQEVSGLLMWIWLSRTKTSLRQGEATKLARLLLKMERLQVRAIYNIRKLIVNGVFLATTWMTFSRVLYNFIGMYIVFFWVLKSNWFCTYYISRLAKKTLAKIFYPIRSKSDNNNNKFISLSLCLVTYVCLI